MRIGASQNSFHVAFGVEAWSQMGLLDQLEYCPKVQSVLKFAQST
jgi:hypothetical protein